LTGDELDPGERLLDPLARPFSSTMSTDTRSARPTTCPAWCSTISLDLQLPIVRAVGQGQTDTRDRAALWDQLADHVQADAAATIHRSAALGALRLPWRRKAPSR
jgi:hypothetical protein